MGRVTDAGCGWFVWHKGLASSFSGTSHTPANDEYIRLDENYQKGQFTGSAVTGTPLKTITDTVINLDSTQSTLGGITTPLNKNSGVHILYAWRGITGVSAFGSYTGATDRTLDLDFFPKLLIVKRTNGSAHWVMYDTSRSGASASGNNMLPYLSPNNDEAEASANDRVDLYESGSIKGVQFKSTDNYSNHTSGTYIYMAFA